MCGWFEFIFRMAFFNLFLQIDSSIAKRCLAGRIRGEIIPKQQQSVSRDDYVMLNATRSCLFHAVY